MVPPLNRGFVAVWAYPLIVSGAVDGLRAISIGYPTLFAAFAAKWRT
jgi:hypothetical protein